MQCCCSWDYWCSPSLARLCGLDCEGRARLSSAVVKAPAHRCELAPVSRPCFTPAESRSAFAGGAHEAEGVHCADWRRRVPVASAAQNFERLWRIGYLSSTEAPGEPEAQHRRRLLEEALARLGYVEGKNLTIERRLLSDQVERVNDAAAELLALQPDLIIAVNTPDVSAVLSLTKAVPIVFVNPADPIGSGFIASLARPGGNATGTTGLTVELISKRLEIARDGTRPKPRRLRRNGERHLAGVGCVEPDYIRCSSHGGKGIRDVHNVAPLSR